MEKGNGVLHAFQRGGHRGREPHQRGLMLSYRLRHVAGVYILAQIDDRVAVIFQ